MEPIKATTITIKMLDLPKLKKLRIYPREGLHFVISRLLKTNI